MNPVSVVFTKILLTLLSLVLIVVLTAVTWQKLGVGPGLAVGLTLLGIFHVSLFVLFSVGGSGIGLQDDGDFRADEDSPDLDTILKQDGTLNVNSTEYYVTYLEDD